MAKSVYERIKEICLSLPETKVTMTWGNPHFRGGRQDLRRISMRKTEGKPTVGFKLEMGHADAVVEDPRFSRAAYVGRYGWVSMDASNIKDWNQVHGMLLESYRLIAPKKLWAQVEAASKPQYLGWRAQSGKEDGAPQTVIQGRRVRWHHALNVGSRKAPMPRDVVPWALSSARLQCSRGCVSKSFRPKKRKGSQCQESYCARFRGFLPSPSEPRQLAWPVSCSCRCLQRCSLLPPHKPSAAPNSNIRISPDLGP